MGTRGILAVDDRRKKKLWWGEKEIKTEKGEESRCQMTLKHPNALKKCVLDGL